MGEYIYRGNKIAKDKLDGKTVYYFYLLKEIDITEFGPYKSLREAKASMNKELNEDSEWLREDD